MKVAPPHLSEKQKGKRRRVDTPPRDLFDGSDGREESPVASENDDVDDELPVLSGKQKGKRTKVNPVLDPDVAANDEAVRVKRRRSSLNGEQAAMSTHFPAPCRYIAKIHCCSCRTPRFEQFQQSHPSTHSLRRQCCHQEELEEALEERTGWIESDSR